VDRYDAWPHEPRDEARCHLYRPRRAGTSHRRADYVERLADYGCGYADSLVPGCNPPQGVHWSKMRRRYVAREF